MAFFQTYHGPELKLAGTSLAGGAACLRVRAAPLVVFEPSSGRPSSPVSIDPAEVSRAMPKGVKVPVSLIQIADSSMLVRMSRSIVSPTENDSGINFEIATLTAKNKETRAPSVEATAQTLLENIEASVSLYNPQIDSKNKIRRIGITLECKSGEVITDEPLLLSNSKIVIQFSLHDTVNKHPERKLQIVFIQEPGEKGQFYILKKKSANEGKEEDAESSEEAEAAEDQRDHVDVEPAAAELKELEAGGGSDLELVGLDLVAAAESTDVTVAEQLHPRSAKRKVKVEAPRLGNTKLEFPQEHYSDPKFSEEHKKSLVKDVSLEFKGSALLPLFQYIITLEDNAARTRLTGKLAETNALTDSLGELVGKIETIAEKHFGAIQQKADEARKRLQKKAEKGEV